MAAFKIEAAIRVNLHYLKFGWEPGKSNGAVSMQLYQQLSDRNYEHYRKASTWLQKKYWLGLGRVEFFSGRVRSENISSRKTRRIIRDPGVELPFPIKKQWVNAKQISRLILKEPNFITAQCQTLRLNALLPNDFNGYGANHQRPPRYS